MSMNSSAKSAFISLLRFKTVQMLMGINASRALGALPAALEGFLQPVIGPGVHWGFWALQQRGLQLAGNPVEKLTILVCFSF